MACNCSSESRKYCRVDSVGKPHSVHTIVAAARTATRASANANICVNKGPLCANAGLGNGDQEPTLTPSPPRGVVMAERRPGGCRVFTFRNLLIFALLCVGIVPQAALWATGIRKLRRANDALATSQAFVSANKPGRRVLYPRPLALLPVRYLIACAARTMQDLIENAMLSRTSLDLVLASIWVIISRHVRLQAPVVFLRDPRWRLRAQDVAVT
jgi:hypothetical protein